MSFNFFDKVYCIHLPNDRERKSKIQKQFESVGIIDVKFVSATPPPAKFSMSNMRRNARGEFGVNLSQIKAIVQAISDGAQYPLFFEDDIVFNSWANEHINFIINELPNDWRVLYFGGHPRGPVPARRAKRYSDHLWKIQRYSFADAYCIRGEQLLHFYNFWLEHITQEDAMYDFILGEYAGANNGYAAYPILCEQYAGKSSVTNKHDDKSNIIARAWAAHIGPNNLVPKHKAIFDEWKRKNPGKWETSLRNMAKKR